MSGVEGFAGRLRHRFDDPALLAAALTHRSADRRRHNERLEFLGDGVLSMVIAAELYRRRPEAREGELSRLRALLVRRETLAEIAAELDLGAHLQLGGGELKSGGHRRASILSDALEAVLGAVFLDGGYEAARAEVLAMYGERLDRLPAAEGLKDPKTRLQELLQGRQLPLPEYRIAAVEGAAHAQRFVIECRVEGLARPVTGEGASRRKAEQDAAAKALARLEPSGV